MRSHKYVTKSKAFVLTSDALLQLVDAISVDKSKIKFTISCVDGTKLYPTSIDELLSYPNPKSREIDRIDLSSSSGDGQQCDITFHSEEYLGPITYWVGGEDAYVVTTSDTIEQHLETMTSSGLNSVSTSFFLREILSTFLAALAFVAIVLGSILLGHISGTGFAGAVLLTGGGMLLVVVSKYNRLRKYFFPRSSFCIGDGEARYRRMTDRRGRFGLAALVSLVIALFARLLWSGIAYMSSPH